MAVGILVDDATVTIENINRHLEEGASVENAILEGSPRRFCVPALVSTLSICIVFVPMFLLAGVSRYLFVPMAEAVVFAMLTSYVLSRTLIPTLAKYWLRTHAEEQAAKANPNAWQRFQGRFEARFRSASATGITGCSARRWRTAARSSSSSWASSRCRCCSTRSWAVTSSRTWIPGRSSCTCACRPACAWKKPLAQIDRIEAAIRKVIPQHELASIVDNVGLPVSGINITYGNSGTIGTSDADVLISLHKDHEPTADYIKTLREVLPQEFPGTSFAFLPADIVSQILNFGLPSPINIQIVGASPKNRDVANEILEKLRHVPGLVDLRIQQTFSQPELRVVTDRSRAQELGFSQKDVANNLLLTLRQRADLADVLAESQTSVQYPIVAQTPQYRMDSLADLQNVPINAGTRTQLLSGLASILAASARAWCRTTTRSR